MIALVCAWGGLFATYLVFAGQVSGEESVAGGLCAAAAVLWWIGTRRASAHTFAFEADAWFAAGRAGRKLPAATLAVAAALLRTLTARQGGEVTRTFFAHGRRTDPLDGSRRAIGVLAASLAPDRFVLRTPLERDEIVIHALTRSPPSDDPRWPI